jgi:hypothetical protein
MAEGKKIKYEDLFDPKLEDQVKKLEATFTSLKDSLKEFATVAGKEIKMSGMKTPEDMQKLAKGINDVEQAEKALKVVTDEELKAQLALKEAQRERTATLKAQVKAEKEAEGSVAQLRAKLSSVTLEWAKLSKEERENTKAGKDLVKSKKQLTEELKKLEAATGDHRRNVGNYTDAIKGLPGPIGDATNSAIAMGEALWALVANPIGAVIAAIAAAGYVLYQSFTFTDTGANKLKGTLMGLKDAYDNIKFAIGEFLTNNEKLASGFKALLGAANPLIAATLYLFEKPIENAQKYVDAIDEVEDRETAYISAAAENRNKIARLEFTAANPAELKQKRIQALQDAINLQNEEAKKAVEFAQKKYDAEVNRIASNLTIKADEVKRIVALNDVQQMEEAKKNKAIRDLMEFAGGERLKTLEELNAAIIDADTKKFEEEKGNMKKMEKLLMDLDKVDEERRKKAEEKRKKEEEAKLKQIADEEKRKADLKAFYNKSIQDQVFALETEQMDLENKQGELSFQQKIDFENRKYAWMIQKADLTYDELERLRVEHEKRLKEIMGGEGDGGAEFQNAMKEWEDWKKVEQQKREDQIKEIEQTASQIYDAIKKGLEDRAKLQQEHDQKAIDQQKNMVDRQAKLAAEGRENALADAEAQLAKAERKKLDDAKKAQRQQESLELAKVFLNLVAEYSKDNPNNATAKALAMTLIAKGISKSIAGAFATGVEGLEGEGTETSDSNIALLSKGESVITARGTRNNPGLATAMNKGLVDEYFQQVYLPQFSASNRLDIPKGEQVNNALLSVLNHKLSALETAIKDKPVSTTKLNGLGEWTEEVQSNNIRIITHHRKGRNRF